MRAWAGMALLGAALVVQPAMAADLVTDEVIVDDVIDSSAFDWTGFYVGVAVGAADATFTSESSAATHQLDEYDPMEGNGWVAGLNFGYDHQLDNGFVLGLDGEINWSDISAEIVTSDEEWHAYLDWYAAIAAKAGFSVGQALIYGKAGIAIGGVTLSATDNVDPSNSPAEASNTPVGAILGVGAEVAVSDSFSLFAEADWIGFGQEEYDLTSTGYMAVETTDVGVGVIKVGARFRL